jgi:hypothetical protein
MLRKIGHREYNDANLLRERSSPRYDLEATSIREVKIHDNHIRIVMRNLREGLSL